jgi:hypothetical protein
VTIIHGFTPGHKCCKEVMRAAFLVKLQHTKIRPLRVHLVVNLTNEIHNYDTACKIRGNWPKLALKRSKNSHLPFAKACRWLSLTPPRIGSTRDKTFFNRGANCKPSRTNQKFPLRMELMASTQTWICSGEYTAKLNNTIELSSSSSFEA